MGYVTKREMINDLHPLLIAAGYEVTKSAISRAYRGVDGSRKLYGLWLRRGKAINWVAQKLTARNVALKRKPDLFVPPPPPEATLVRPPRGPGDWQLPVGDRD